MFLNLLNITIMGIKDWVFWLIIALIAGIFEVATINLVSVWFIVGAIAAFIASLTHASLALQLVLFFAISIAGLLVFILAIRPKVQVKRERKTATNADRIIGKTAIVTESIDTTVGRGLIRVNNQIWSARNVNEDEVLEAGTEVLVLGISGVKAVVRRLEAEEKIN